MRRTAASFIFASVLLTGTALASGYGLRDTSAATLGVSYAGNAANGTVASTMTFNPALVNDVGSFDIAVSNIALVPQTSGTFTATTAVGTPVTGDTKIVDIVNTALIPSIAVRYRISPEWTLGLQTSSPWGMITDYGNSSVTRYYATMSDVKSANAQFVVGYQPSSQLSFAAGMQVQYIKGRLSKAIDVGSISYGLYAHHTLPSLIPGTNPGHNDGWVELRAQSWSYGWVVGAEWKPNDKLSVGLSYRSPIYNTLKGNEYFTLDSVGQTLRSYTGLFQDGTATAAFHNPAIVTFGLRYEINKEWTFLAGGDFTGWSIMDQLTAHSNHATQPDDVNMFNYKDSFFGSIGVQYKPNDTWKFSLGTAYDETPSINRYRTPGIPDGGRYWYSLGVGYRMTDKMDLDFSIARLAAKKGVIALSVADPGNSSRGSLYGNVNLRVTLIGMEVNYHL